MVLVKLWEESLLADETSIEHNALNKRIEERTSSLSGDIVCGCEGTIERVEGELVKSVERFAEVVYTITALESVLGSMGLQLRRMQEGSGHTFFPQPIFSNPQAPVSVVHALNACPMCGFWYSCNNFVSLGCGHTYHHWCLTKHAKKVRICLVDSCGKPFEVESNASIGIRPLPAAGSEQVVL